MVTTNRIRLTGLLKKSPRFARAFPFRLRNPRIDRSADGTGKARTAFMRRRRVDASSPRFARAFPFLCALLVAGSAAAAPPTVNAPIPTEPAALARTLVQTTADLEQAISDWSPKSAAAPQLVVLQALYQQRIYRLLTRNSRLATHTLALVPQDLAKVSRDLLAAQRELYRLTPPIGVQAIKVARPRPGPELLGYYEEAQHRFEVPWNVLAAVNFVETKFGKLRSASAAGAQGPMQFMPATWRRYGLGGNVQDAHDAIIGAANYLRASGAPRDLRNALYHYNPSGAYVDAVLRYARRIGADRTIFYALYSWQVFVKTPRGDRRVTGPGLP
jgi:membrane-bound lytic murein transglycosylase B